MKVRVRDIALQAGVSPATVSNALNGRAGVSKESARQILQIAKELGYAVPKTSKQTERGYVRLVILKKHGLVVMDTQFFMELIEAIERQCQVEGLELIITHVHIGLDSDYRERINSICAEKCAGVLLLSTEIDETDLQLFNECQSPLLSLDNLFRHEHVHSVVMNNYDAGYRATNALYDMGHRKIGHITSKVAFNNMRYRRKGYQAAMIEKGLPVDEDSIWRITPTMDGAYQDMKALLDENRPLPTAFFAGNDIMAIGCMQALNERGIIVPRDLSIIGMDDTAICKACTPPLSTIRVFRKEMGMIAVKMLLQMIPFMEEGKLKTELDVQLVERGTVAKPRQGK